MTMIKSRAFKIGQSPSGTLFVEYCVLKFLGDKDDDGPPQQTSDSGWMKLEPKGKTALNAGDVVVVVDRLPATPGQTVNVHHYGDEALMEEWVLR